MAKQTDDLLATCKRTFDFLDAAIAEGNDDVLLDTAEQTATKISGGGGELTGEPIGLLAPIILAWRSARRLRRGLRA